MACKNIFVILVQGHSAYSYICRNYKSQRQDQATLYDTISEITHIHDCPRPSGSNWQIPFTHTLNLFVAISATAIGVLIALSVGFT